jgi:hypothetical protein
MGTEPAWLEFSTGARQMLSKAYADYLACDWSFADTPSP